MRAEQRECTDLYRVERLRLQEGLDLLALERASFLKNELACTEDRFTEILRINPLFGTAFRILRSSRLAKVVVVDKATGARMVGQRLEGGEKNSVEEIR